MSKIKNYFKWLFSKWYFYVIIFINLVSYLNQEDFQFNTPEYVLGKISGVIVFWIIIFIIFYLFRKKQK